MSLPPKMTPEQIEQDLTSLPEWSEVGGTIQRTYQFKDFVTAMKFLNAVAEYAERVQHHPDAMVRYSKVTLTLSTHDAGGITRKDFDAARHADQLAAELPAPAPVPVSEPKPKASPMKVAKRKT